MTVIGVHGVGVRVTGPDPTQAKVKGRAFFLTDNGTTVISCSGTLVVHANQPSDQPQLVAEIVTSAASIASFFAVDHDVEDTKGGGGVKISNAATKTKAAKVARQTNAGHVTKLVPGTRIEVCFTASAGGAPRWIRVSERVRVVSLHHASAAVARTFGTRDPAIRGTSLCSVAMLSCPVSAIPASLLPVGTINECVRTPVVISERIPRVCEAITVVSSPFGLVAPELLLNSVTSGIVCSRLAVPRPNNGSTGGHTQTTHAAAVEHCKAFETRSSQEEEDVLIITDARCLHGSEGGPVFNHSGQWIGIVAPLMHKFNNAVVELYVVIPVSSIRAGVLLDSQTSGIATTTTAITTAATGRNLVPTASPVTCSSTVGCRFDNAMRSGNTLQPFDTLPQHQQAMRAVVPNNQTGTAMTSALRNALTGVALVQVGRSWGSAFLISPRGFMLTCAHVVKPYMAQTASSTVADVPPNEAAAGAAAKWVCTEKVWVSFRDSQPDNKVHHNDDNTRSHHKLLARVVFCARGPVDVAVLQVVDPMALTKSQCCAVVPVLQHLNTHSSRRRQRCSGAEQHHERINDDGRRSSLSESSYATAVDGDPYQLGQPVFALGYGYIEPASDLGATVTRGSLAKVISHAGGPALLQSSASVFHGHSGGLLVDASGRALGMLTINGERSDGSSIPRLNFSIALHMLAPLLDAATLGTGSGDDDDGEVVEAAMCRAAESVDVHDKVIESLLQLESVNHGDGNEGGDGNSADMDMLHGTRFGEFLKDLESGKYDALRRKSKL